MNRRNLARKLAALSFVTAVTMFTSGVTLAQPSGTMPLRLSDQSIRMQGLIGQSVVGDHGGEICRIEDVLVKPGGGEPTVIVSFSKTGTAGRSLVALPLSKVQIEGRSARLGGMTRQQLEAMPSFQYPAMPGSG